MTRSTLRILLCCTLIPLALTGAALRASAEPSGIAGMDPAARSHASTPGQGDPYGGFRAGRMSASFVVGAGPGAKIFGSHLAHDLAGASAQLGWVLTDVRAPGRWYAGNWELAAELFAGSQFNPDARYVVGLGPLLRYNFITGTPFVPFVGLGAGMAITDIGEPDLSTRYQFFPQFGFGTAYFLRGDMAVTAELRLLHLSNAGLETPNQGVNTFFLGLGFKWFF